MKDLAENKISKSRAIVILGYSNVHINRLLKKYKLEGKIAFSHGNKNKIIKLYEQKYFNFNITHFNEFLNNVENIKVSIPTVTKILKDAFILSPKAHKKTKKDLIQLIEKKQVESKSKKVIYKLQNAHVYLQKYQNYPTRPSWFCNGTYAHLHIAIDDHSGKILSAFFDKEETLKAYYQITYDMIVNYGIPYSILTDKRTVFEYKNKSNKSIENDTFTQYGYACHRLGIDLKTTSIPQAKGRVERAFSTLQSRLVNE